jgi:hypothetical protein
MFPLQLFDSPLFAAVNCKAFSLELLTASNPQSYPQPAATACRILLDHSFLFCTYSGMERINALTITNTLLSAPAWALIGLTVRDDQMRESAAAELADLIVRDIQPMASEDRDQLPLPL